MPQETVTLALSPEMKKQRRAERTLETHRRNAQVRAWLIGHGYRLPVRVISSLFVRVLDKVANPARIEKIGDDGTLWMIESSSGKLEYKVERLPDGRYTCSCPKWVKQRFVDCRHIEEVLSFEAPSGSKPYKNARRERAPRIFYPDETFTELTRRQHAYAKMADRFLDLAEAACRTIDEPPRKKTRGRPPAPLKARAYAIIAKSWLGGSYEIVVKHLQMDPRVRGLGLHGKIDKKSLYNWAGDSRLVAVMKSLVQKVAMPGRKMEDTLLFDGSGRPMTPSGDWLEAQYGRPSKVRPLSKFIKEHYAVGRYSRLVPCVEFSLKERQGSADVVHLRTLGELALDVFPKATVWIADKAYGSKGNGQWCEDNGITLYTRAKTNEKRESGEWPESMREIARLEKTEPKKFRHIYNQRSLAEAQPSRSKRYTRSRSLQRRITDRVMEIPPGTEESEKALTSRPQDELREIVQRQEDAIGIAMLNEGYAIYVRDNICALIMLEELHGQEVSFVSGFFAFEPIPTIDLDEMCGIECDGQCGHRSA
ncbi:MAG: transposase [Vulcanimicrobiaceae bacterium]